MFLISSFVPVCLRGSVPIWVVLPNTLITCFVSAANHLLCSLCIYCIILHCSILYCTNCTILYCILTTVLTVLYSLYCTHCTILTVLYSLYCTHCTILTVLYSLYTWYSPYSLYCTHCTILTVLLSIHLVLTVLYSLYHTNCTILSIHPVLTVLTVLYTLYHTNCTILFIHPVLAILTVLTNWTVLTVLQVQCHTLTGYCWCVTTDGKPVSGSSVHNKTPVCSGTRGRGLLQPIVFRKENHQSEHSNVAFVE